MSEPFEAAVRAAYASIFSTDDPDKAQDLRDLVAVILAAALPPDPAPETKERALWQACCGTDHCNAANHAPDHDISADGYAERYGCESKEMSDEFDRYYAAIRASLLPGEEPT